MNIQLLIGAAFAALMALFSAGPDVVSGRITAVDGDAIRVQVDGGREIAVRMDEATDVQVRTQTNGALAADMGCFEGTRPEDRSDWTGERVTIFVEEANGVIRALTITVLPWACDVPYRTQPADAVAPPPMREKQAAGDSGR
jgi:hypothetical protein